MLIVNPHRYRINNQIALSSEFPRSLSDVQTLSYISIARALWMFTFVAVYTYLARIVDLPRARESPYPVRYTMLRLRYTSHTSVLRACVLDIFFMEILRA